MRCASETKRKSCAVPVEAPGAPLLNYFQLRLVVAVKKRVCHLSRRILVGELERLRADTSARRRR